MTWRTVRFHLIRVVITWVSQVVTCSITEIRDISRFKVLCYQIHSIQWWMRWMYLYLWDYYILNAHSQVFLFFIALLAFKFYLESFLLQSLSQFKFLILNCIILWYSSYLRRHFRWSWRPQLSLQHLRNWLGLLNGFLTVIFMRVYFDELILISRLLIKSWWFKMILKVVCLRAEKLSFTVILIIQSDRPWWCLLSLIYIVSIPLVSIFNTRVFIFSWNIVTSALSAVWSQWSRWWNNITRWWTNIGGSKWSRWAHTRWEHTKYIVTCW